MFVGPRSSDFCRREKACGRSCPRLVGHKEQKYSIRWTWCVYLVLYHIIINVQYWCILFLINLGGSYCSRNVISKINLYIHKSEYFFNYWFLRPVTIMSEQWIAEMGGGWSFALRHCRAFERNDKSPVSVGRGGGGRVNKSAPERNSVNRGCVSKYLFSTQECRNANENNNRSAIVRLVFVNGKKAACLERRLERSNWKLLSAWRIRTIACWRPPLPFPSVSKWNWFDWLEKNDRN